MGSEMCIRDSSKGHRFEYLISYLDKNDVRHLRSLDSNQAKLMLQCYEISKLKPNDGFVKRINSLSNAKFIAEIKKADFSRLPALLRMRKKSPKPAAVFKAIFTRVCKLDDDEYVEGYHRKTLDELAEIVGNLGLVKSILEALNSSDYLHCDWVPSWLCECLEKNRETTGRKNILRALHSIL